MFDLGDVFKPSSCYDYHTLVLCCSLIYLCLMLISNICFISGEKSDERSTEGATEDKAQETHQTAADKAHLVQQKEVAHRTLINLD